MARTRSAAATERMLAATARLALDEGLHQVTIERVAERSGVAKTTIYRHFPRRQELLIAALDRVIEPPLAPDTGSLVGDLAAFLASVRPAFTSTEVRTLSLEIYAASARDPELDALRQAFFGGRMGPLWSVVARAVARGEIGDALDLSTAIELIEGPFIVRSLVDPARIVAADVDALAADIAARLVAAAPPP